MGKSVSISSKFSADASVVVHQGNCLDMLEEIRNETVQLVVTSPPYNLGKEYERKLRLDEYIAQQRKIIGECVRILRDTGSICWQVGNYVDKGTIIPLDTVLSTVFWDLGLKMRNRIIWHFGHGLHCSKRFSGRYETIIWFTKSDDYVFNLDPVRVPQKYPGKKHFRGAKAGEYSCNPLGKNPSDLWVFPNVKNNHIEKTIHPCQYPVELVERLVLSLTNEEDWVFDPFLGVGTSIVAAVRHNRRGAGAEIVGKYVKIAKSRISKAAEGTLRVRPMNQPVYDPRSAGTSLTTAPSARQSESVEHEQLRLLEKPAAYGEKQ